MKIYSKSLYWYGTDEESKKYPMPVENSWNDTPERKEEFLKKLRALLSKSSAIHYKGFSTCRLCGKVNGSQEFEVRTELMTFYIPEGYLHYLTDHNVQPDEDLYGILLGENLTNTNLQSPEAVCDILKSNDKEKQEKLYIEIINKYKTFSEVYAFLKRIDKWHRCNVGTGLHKWHLS